MSNEDDDENESDLYLPNEQQQSQESDTLIPHNTLSVDKVIFEIGTGPYQYFVFAITGIIWAADAMEMMLLSFLLPELKKAWGLDGNLCSLIGVSVFLGMLIGATSLAILSDKYGRRKVIIGGVICTCLFGILSGCAPNLTAMCIFRFGVGFFMTVGSVAFTLFAELIPTEKDPMPNAISNNNNNSRHTHSEFLTRGKLLILQGIFWSFGALFNVFLAWIILSNLDWRWYLIISSFPLMIASIGSFYIPESPHWLIVSGNYDKAKNLLISIAEWNGTSDRLPSEWKLQRLQNDKIENKKRGNIFNLFSSKRRDTTIILYVIYSCCVFAYYGISFISVRYFERLDRIKQDGSAIYWEMLITTFAEVPALILGILLIDRLGRRGLMNVSFLAFSVCSYILVIHKFQRIRDFGIALVFIGRMFINLGFTGLAIYFVEYYPTYIRATALGFAISLGRFAGIVTTFTAESMSITLGLYLYGCAGLVAFIASILIQRDSMNIKLVDQDKSSSRQLQSSSQQNV